uniref:Lactosylceramide 4-alpha-galactosyltransferase n=1 Tax=Rhizophora mucronata TaxID=61149 RepID=A0A2P2ISQ7_RHIMU
MLLRNLRPRRRPLYGAQLCAVASALLLLLSVALLYNRLSSSSSSSQNPRHLHSQSQWQLQDEQEDSDFLVSSDSNGDKIDELDDVVEVDKDRHADADDLFWDGADQDNNNDPTTSTNSFLGHHAISSASSGYFLDHVTGSIRRALNKRSIDQWDYDYNHNFHSFGAAEDDESTASNSAFASDDIPIDEVVRRKLGDVVGIEDALLLKTAKRASPLRQGWGDWFDKKADFLRRDRMFKSNSEVLNPVNNPLLQDPDVVGVTGLTRGDKAVHKLLLSEFKRTPFLVKKPLSVSETAHEDNLAGNVGDVRSGNGDHRVPNRGNAGAKAAETELETMPEMKGSERRTLDENASNGLHDKAVHYVENNLISGRNGNLYRTNDDGANSVQDYYSSKLHIERIDEYSRNKKSNGNKNPLEEVTSGDSELRRMDGMQDRQSKTPQQKSEDPSHVFADGKRWGYFPGLHPHLPFSDFMGSFFKKGKCSMTVFMVWNSPPWMYSVRHQRGLESLLSHHRDACVVVFSETIELDFFKNSFLKDGWALMARLLLCVVVFN